MVGVLAYAAAPALSQQPYMPPAVDFEQPLGPVARVAPPGAAAKPHAGGEESVSFRTGRDRGAASASTSPGSPGRCASSSCAHARATATWTPWIETGNGDPVYFGGADELQLRTRGYRPAGTLHYVNVSGTTSTSQSILTRFREAVNSAFISASSLVDADAEALPAKPPMVTRAAWGADRAKSGCPPRSGPAFGKVRSAAVHHTVTAGNYSAAEAPGIVLGICRYHRNANGWNDIGYNALVDRFGTLYQGRAGGIAKAVVGAHAQGFNSETTSISAIGTHTTVPLSPQGRQSVVSYLAWKLAKHHLPAAGKVTLTSAGGEASRYDSGERVRLNRIIGHRDVGLTACPGDALYAILPQLRSQVQTAIDTGGGVTPPTTPPLPPPVIPPAGGVKPH